MTTTTCARLSPIWRVHSNRNPARLIPRIRSRHLALHRIVQSHINDPAIVLSLSLTSDIGYRCNLMMEITMATSLLFPAAVLTLQSRKWKLPSREPSKVGKNHRELDRARRYQAAFAELIQLRRASDPLRHTHPMKGFPVDLRQPTYQRIKSMSVAESPNTHRRAPSNVRAGHWRSLHDRIFA